jgi:hypothetical protein
VKELEPQMLSSEKKKKRGIHVETQKFVKYSGSHSLGKSLTGKTYLILVF